MRAILVVEADPAADSACGVRYAIEALATDALPCQGPDHTLDQAVLLRAVRRDELLPQAVAFHQGRVFSTLEAQAIARRQAAPFFSH